MRLPRSLIPAAFFLLASSAAPPPQITVARNEVESRFPLAAVFTLEASSSHAITDVVLEFATDAKTCGESTDRVVPDDFAVGPTVVAHWTWDLRRTGALPPGTTIAWRWIVRDDSGAELVTPDRTIVIDDTQYDWRETTAGPLRLHWYSGDSSFARDLLEAGEEALQTIRHATGIVYEGEIRAYVYADASAMQSATLFAPAWSGGLAFPEHRAVLTAIAPSELEWGRRAMAHELTHVVIGHYTFSCLDSTPPWVSEGLAMYAEGEAEEWTEAVLEDAIRDNSLLPVRALSQIFSNDPDLANLSYAQSRSLVAFLIEAYGPEEMLRLLDEFRAGTPEDRALDRVYGFDRDGLEAAWREHIGAPPAPAVEGPGARPTITAYPTFAPLVGVPLAATSTPAPTPSATPEPAPRPGPCAGPAALAAVGLALAWLPRSPRRW